MWMKKTDKGNRAMRNMASMMQKISGLQGKMQDLQAELDMQFEANAAGGQVRAVVNGKKHIIRLILTLL